MKKKLMALCLAFVCLFAFGAAASADSNSNVVFSGDAENFIFLNGSDSLFDNFRGIMPGETRTQEITLKNDDYREMKFYLSADLTEKLAEGKAFGAVYEITLSRNGENFFDGKLGGENEKDKGFLGDHFLLAALKQGESTVITMSLTVDGDSMDNGYQDAEGKMQFVFSVEHDTDDLAPSASTGASQPQQGGNVTTGDSPTGVWTAVGLGIGGTALLIVIFLLRKKKED